METSDYSECPVCDRVFIVSEIETHVNRCLFLNSTENESSKRKRNTSPSLLNKSGSSLGERSSVYDEKKRKISETNIAETPDETVEIISEASSESFEFKIVDEDNCKNLQPEGNFNIGHITMKPNWPCKNDFGFRKHKLSYFTILRKKIYRRIKKILTRN